MAIVRWEPFRDLLSTQDRFNRLFNDTFSRFFDEGDLGARTWAPPVDVYETEHDVVLKAELPGVDPKEVEVRVEDGTLYLKGERKFENEVKQDNYHRIERAYGSFVRRFVGSIGAAFFVGFREKGCENAGEELDRPAASRSIV